MLDRRDYKNTRGYETNLASYLQTITCVKQYPHFKLRAAHLWKQMILPPGFGWNNKAP